MTKSKKRYEVLSTKTELQLMKPIEATNRKEASELVRIQMQQNGGYQPFRLRVL